MVQGWVETLSKGIFYLKLEFELKIFFLSYKGPAKHSRAFSC